MQKRLTCYISGLVQGVMFRDFAKREAEKMDLTGTAENLPDGRVLVVAEGDEAALQKFPEVLRRKISDTLPTARVDDVEEHWDDAAGKFSDFRILY